MQGTSKNQTIAIIIVLVAVGGYFGNLILKNNKQKAQVAESVQQVVPQNNSNTMNEGLTITDVVVGTGAEAKAGDVITVHYTGKLESGQVFDSSIPRGTPATFQVGVGQLIKGWDLGIPGMKVGGKRTLVIKSELAYGEQGVPGAIPPNSTLTFDVELVKVEGR